MKRHLLIVLIAFMVTFNVVIAAERPEKVDLGFHDDIIGPRFMIFNLIEQICGLGFGEITVASIFECDSDGCTGEIRAPYVLPNADVLLTPDFSLLFSRLHSFNTKHTSVEKLEVTQETKRISIDVISEEVGFSKEEAERIAACVKEVGTALAEKLLGTKKKDLLKTEFERSDQQDVARKANTVVLSKLEHAKLTVSYPPILKIKETGLIAVTVVPSLRLYPKIKSTENMEVYVRDKILKELPKIPSELRSSMLQKLKDKGLEGEGVYRIKRWESAVLAQVPNQFQTLTAELKGSKFEQVIIAPLEQPLNPLMPSRWLWQIEPKDEGMLELYLSLASSSTSKRETFSQVFPISIRVEYPYYLQVYAFVINNWQWIAGTILIPLAVFWWQKRTKTNSKSKNANKDNSVD